MPKQRTPARSGPSASHPQRAPRRCASSVRGARSTIIHIRPRPCTNHHAGGTPEPDHLSRTILTCGSSDVAYLLVATCTSHIPLPTHRLCFLLLTPYSFPRIGGDSARSRLGRSRCVSVIGPDDRMYEQDRRQLSRVRCTARGPVCGQVQHIHHVHVHVHVHVPCSFSPCSPCVAARTCSAPMRTQPFGREWSAASARRNEAAA